jgi:hypothetical protein
VDAPELESLAQSMAVAAIPIDPQQRCAGRQSHGRFQPLLGTFRAR